MGGLVSSVSALDFSSGHDLRELSPASGSALSRESA